MGELITKLDELIFNKDGVPMTNSLKVANYFGKRQKTSKKVASR